MKEFKFKVGDVVNTKLGLTGVIIEIDPDWMFPYHVDFGAIDTEVDLFAENELELATEENVAIDEFDEPSYINIKFQEGAILEHGVNGCQIEDVINILIDRLEGFQKGNFPCRENALAITKLQEAKFWLEHRTAKRKKQGVEGKSEKHE